MYEIYLGTDSNKKTYIVATDSKIKPDVLGDYARKYFHVGLDRIDVHRGWTLGEELWFENQKKKGQKICWVANTKRKN